MTVDYRELHKVVPPIHVAVPNTTQLLNEVSECLSICHFVLDLANAFFSVPIDPQSQDQFAFSCNEECWMFQVWSQGYLHSPTIC